MFKLLQRRDFETKTYGTMYYSSCIWWLLRDSKFVLQLIVAKLRN